MKHDSEAGDLSFEHDESQKDQTLAGPDSAYFSLDVHFEGFCEENDFIAFIQECFWVKGQGMAHYSSHKVAISANDKFNAIFGLAYMDQVVPVDRDRPERSQGDAGTPNATANIARMYQRSKNCLTVQSREMFCYQKRVGVRPHKALACEKNCKLPPFRIKKKNFDDNSCNLYNERLAKTVSLED